MTRAPSERSLNSLSSCGELSAREDIHATV